MTLNLAISMTSTRSKRHLVSWLECQTFRCVLLMVPELSRQRTSADGSHSIALCIWQQRDFLQEQVCVLPLKTAWKRQLCTRLMCTFVHSEDLCYHDRETWPSTE